MGAELCMLFLQKQILLHGVVVIVRLCDSHCGKRVGASFMRMVLEMGRWACLKVPSGDADLWLFAEMICPVDKKRLVL